MQQNMLYWLLVTGGVVLGGWAITFIAGVASHVHAALGSQVGHSGGEAAQLLLDRLGIAGVRVVETTPAMPDALDVATGEIRLKPDSFRAKRTGALFTAAHEVGHVVQRVRYPRLMAWRTRLFRPLGKVLMVTGLLLVAARLVKWPILFALGGVGYLIGVLMLALKLLEELDASRRGIRLLVEADLLPPARRLEAVIQASLNFGTYVGYALIPPVLFGFLLWA